MVWMELHLQISAAARAVHRFVRFNSISEAPRQWMDGSLMDPHSPLAGSLVQASKQVIDMASGYA